MNVRSDARPAVHGAHSRSHRTLRVVIVGKLRRDAHISPVVGLAGSLHVGGSVRARSPLPGVMVAAARCAKSWAMGLAKPGAACTRSGWACPIGFALKVGGPYIRHLS